MSESLSVLRSEVLEVRSEPVRIRYRPEFRSRLLSAAREHLSRGLSVAEIAEQLGLSEKTLSSWLGEVAKTPLRRVLVSPQACRRVEPSGLVVWSGSVRIEGLDVEGVARLLRALS